MIPAAAKKYEMPCLFTVQNIESAKSLLSDVEDRGIDAAAFWRRLFYDRFPGDYEDTRDTNPLDLLLSGILAARYVETANFLLLPNAASGRQPSVLYLPETGAGRKNKCRVCLRNGRYTDPSMNTNSDKTRYCQYGSNQHLAGKQKTETVWGEALLGLIIGKRHTITWICMKGYYSGRW